MRNFYNQQGERHDTLQGVNTDTNSNGVREALWVERQIPNCRSACICGKSPTAAISSFVPRTRLSTGVRPT